MGVAPGGVYGMLKNDKSIFGHSFCDCLVLDEASQMNLPEFAESFRLHMVMADFLREEIYAHDGIAYHSKQTAVLAALPHADDFIARVLAPEYPLVVVVHDEAGSRVSNPVERPT